MALLTAAGSFLLEKLADEGLAKFTDEVINRWSRKRGTAFYRALIEELFNETPDPEQLEAKFSDLFKNESRSEIMFEAYRAVSLSKSKEIGPRIIAVLTAKAIQREPSRSTEIEELVFAAAESLSDFDFERFAWDMDSWLMKRVGSASHPYRYIPDLPLEMELDTNIASRRTPFGGGGETIDLLGESLTLKVGLWADRLCSLGILSEIRRELSRPEGTSGTRSGFSLPSQQRRIERRLRFNEGAFLLREVLRVVAPSMRSPIDRLEPTL